MMEKMSSGFTAAERSSTTVREIARPAVVNSVSASRSSDRTRGLSAPGSVAERALMAASTTSAWPEVSVMTRRTSASSRIHSICSAESVS